MLTVHTLIAILLVAILIVVLLKNFSLILKLFLILVVAFYLYHTFLAGRI